MQTINVPTYKKYNPERPINYSWPEQISYGNPLGAVHYEIFLGLFEFESGFVFRLQSGE